jgi:plasmid stabilization system protein ParE
VTTRRRPRKKPGKPLTVVWTDRALSDLQAIGDFIAADNPTAAERWVDVLMAAAGLASGAPLARRRVPELGRDDIREVFKHTYRIVYRVRDDRMEVLTVFEGHRLFPPDVGREGK